MTALGYRGPRSRPRTGDRAAAVSHPGGKRGGGLLVMTPSGPVELPPFSEMSMAELRDLRRRGHRVEYDARFILSVEVQSITVPLADAVAASPDPARLSRSVRNFVEHVHEAVHPVAGWTASAVADAKTAHLSDPDARARSRQLVVDLATRAPLPEVTDADLSDGSWAVQVIALAEPMDAALSALLRRPRTPVPPGVAVSDAVVAVLRDIDRAARSLAGAVENLPTVLRAEAKRAAEEAAKRPKSADDLRNELRQLGIEV